MITNNIYDNMKEFNELIKDPKFIDFLNNTPYIAFVVTYNKMKFTIIVN